MSDVDDKLVAHTTKNRLAPDTRGKYADDVMQGVTVAWLSQAFRLAPATVKNRLIGCPVMARRSRGEKMVTTLYDLPTAASYLVQPKQSSREYYRALKRGDLPAALSQTVWDALLKRQTYEERAGDLWRTEKVRAVLGSTFQTIKFTMQLWPETLERSQEFNEEQRVALQQMVDALQQEIFDALVKNADEHMTGSSLEELPELVGEIETFAEVKNDIDDDEEIEALV